MATATATKPAVKATPAKTPAKRTTAPKAKPATLTPEETAKLEHAKLLATVAEIRNAWLESAVTESTAVSIWEQAKLQVLNQRVIRVRIAYRAAMVQPHQGKPSIKGAARVLLSEDFGDKDADAAAVNSKNSVAAYVRAATLLEEAGFIHSLNEPTQDERDIVEPVFRATNKRPAKDKPATAPAETETETDGGGTSTPTADDTEAMTFAEVLANLSRFKNSLDVYAKNGGIVTQSDADTVEDIFSDLSAQIAELVA